VAEPVGRLLLGTVVSEQETGWEVKRHPPCITLAREGAVIAPKLGGHARLVFGFRFV